MQFMAIAYHLYISTAVCHSTQFQYYGPPLTQLSVDQPDTRYDVDFLKKKRVGPASIMEAVSPTYCSTLPFVVNALRFKIFFFFVLFHWTIRRIITSRYV